MSTIGSRFLLCCEKALPYTIILPFGYFMNKSYKSARKEIINDSKSGKIKQAFIQTWLKEVALDEVILKEPQMRTESLKLLEEMVQLSKFQNVALQMWINVMHRKPAVDQAMDVCFVISKHVLTQDTGAREGVSQVFETIPYSLNWLDHIDQYLNTSSQTKLVALL